jgi:hypothetical protein
MTMADATALARPPRVYEVGGQAAYTAPPIRGGTNPFSAGFGARFGLVFSGVYVGGNVVRYLGGTDVDTSEHSTLLGGEIGYGLRIRTANDGWFTLRPQLGVGAVTITRVDPSLAAGGGSSTAVRSVSGNLANPDVITQATPRPVRSPSSASPSSALTSLSSSASTPDTISITNVYLQPGVTAILSSGTIFVGANANMLIVPGISYSGDQTTWIAYGLQGELGLCW